MALGRFFLGLGLMLALLGLGLYSAGAVKDSHTPIIQTLEAASGQPDPTAAEQLLTRARQDWDRHRHATAVLSDHGPLEEIEGLFSQAEAYLQAGQMGDFSAICLRLSQLVRATAESHSPTWWNLL